MIKTKRLKDLKVKYDKKHNAYLIGFDDVIYNVSNNVFQNLKKIKVENDLKYDDKIQVFIEGKRICGFSILEYKNVWAINMEQDIILKKVITITENGVEIELSIDEDEEEF